MAKPPAPSDIADKFMLRLPPGMRDRIAAAAKENKRSMNAEIVNALELFFPEPPPISDLVTVIHSTLARIRREEAGGKELSDLYHSLISLNERLQGELDFHPDKQTKP